MRDPAATATNHGFLSPKSRRSSSEGLRRWWVVALLAPVLAGCEVTPCTLVPPPPNSSVTQSEWNGSVRSNCFMDLERLNRWYGQAVPLQPGKSPAGLFIPVGEAGITAGSVVVIAHGWAPGYRAAVDAAGGRLLWWSDSAKNSSGIWSSDWAWVPTNGTAEKLVVSATGLFGQVVVNDAQAIVLGYSWIDDSATVDDSYTDLEYVYRSEAYTSTNGVRLANALEQALAPSFWTGSGNRLHIVGHSHGSKVATVATLVLQSRGRRVDQLTILDTPESETTVAGNGANLLGFYLDQIKTNNGSGPGTFVDNYLSYFAVGFDGTPSTDNVVNVVLDGAVYSCTDPGDRHSYAAEWYGGAAVGAKQFPGLPALGLDWPPPQPTNGQPALNQEWSSGYTPKQQWTLTADSWGSLGCTSSAEGCSYPTATAAVATTGTGGKVSGSPATGLTLAAGQGVTASWFHGYTYYGSSQYGIAFDLSWASPADDDFVVVTGSDSLGNQEVLFVMDGRTAGSGKVPVAINAYVVDYLDFWLYYLPAAGNTTGNVLLQNFRSVSESCDDDAAVGTQVGGG